MVAFLLGSRVGNPPSVFVLVARFIISVVINSGVQIRRGGGGCLALLLSTPTSCSLPVQ